MIYWFIRNLTKYFVDTTILQAAFNTSDTGHDLAIKLLDKALQQKAEPTLYISDYVLDETISLIIARTRSKGTEYTRKIINTIYDNINNSRLYKILDVDETTYTSALIYVKEKRFPLATLTDYTTAVFMRREKIKNILSFDHYCVLEYEIAVSHQNGSAVNLICVCLRK